MGNAVKMIFQALVEFSSEEGDIPMTYCKFVKNIIVSAVQ